MLTRRQILQASAIAATTIAPIPSWALSPASVLNQRSIPSTGEKIPVIGLGTSGNFEVG